MWRLFGAVEKSNLFGFIFVITIDSSPDRLELAEGPPRRLGGLDRGDSVLGPDARAPLLEADLFFDCEGHAAPRGGLGAAASALEDGDARSGRRAAALVEDAAASSKDRTGVGLEASASKRAASAAGAAASSSKDADRPARRFVGDAARVVVEDRRGRCKMANGCGSM